MLTPLARSASLPGQALTLRLNETATLSLQPVWFGMLLQALAALCATTGFFEAGGIFIYALVLLAIYYGAKKRDILTAVLLLVSSYPTAVVFRSGAYIRYNTFFYALIIIAASWLWYKPRSAKGVHGVLIAFGVYLLSLLWGKLSHNSLVEIFGALSGMILLHVLARDARNLEAITKAILLSLLIWVPMLAFLQEPGERFGVVFLPNGRSSFNPISYFSTITIWPAIGVSLLFSEHQVRARRLFMVGLLGAFGVIAYSSSRTMLFTAAIILAPVVLYATRKHLVSTLALTVLAVAAMFIAIQSNEVAQGHVIESTFQAKDLNAASNGRVDILSRGLAKLKDQPLLGVGFGESDVNVGTEVDRTTRIIHSFWGRVLIDAGLIFGLLPFFLLVVYHFFAKMPSGNYWMPGLSFGLVLGMIAYGLVADGLDMTMWPAYGIALAVSDVGRQRQVEGNAS